jgi:hypothetical protein
VSGQPHAPAALPRRKSPWYPLDRRLGGSQSRSGRSGENSWPYRGSNSDLSVVQPLRIRYTNWAIPALGWVGDVNSQNWATYEQINHQNKKINFTNQQHEEGSLALRLHYYRKVASTPQASKTDRWMTNLILLQTGLCKTWVQISPTVPKTKTGLSHYSVTSCSRRFQEKETASDPSERVAKGRYPTQVHYKRLHFSYHTAALPIVQ